MRLGTLCIVACFSLSSYAWAQVEESTPTPETLANWLELGQKEVVEVEFAGTQMQLSKLRDSIQTKVPQDDFDFRLTPGEGGGVNRSSVNICMKVTPENIKRLLAVQEELSPRGYKLDPRRTRVWSYVGDEETRGKATAMVPEFFTVMERGLKDALPKVECTSKKATAINKAALIYKVAGTKAHGMVHVDRITASKYWYGAAGPEQQLFLPHLGLVIQLYYRPAEVGAEKDDSAERDAIRKVFERSVQPFLKLEPGAAVRND